MAKLLVVLGSPQYEEKSISTQVAKHFVTAYKNQNSGDEVHYISVPELAEIRFTKTILAGEPTAEDMKVLQHRQELLTLFKEADKLVIASPMWDFGLPGTVKEVLDAFCVAGETFKYLPEPDENGKIVKALTPSKNVLFIQAMGGMHKGTAGDIGFAQVNAIMDFLGSTNVTYIAAQGVAIPGNTALKDAQLEAEKVATTF